MVGKRLNIFYFFFKQMCQVILRIFFKDYQVQGLEFVPMDKPLLIVANHTNAMVNPLVITILLKRHLTLTGKNLLKKDPFLRVLIWGLDVVLFHRAQDIDKGADRLVLHKEQELKSLEQCMSSYQERLSRQGIYPDEVYLEYPLARVLLFILRELEVMLIGSSVALLGILNNFLPYQMVYFVAAKLSTDLDHWTTNKVYSSMVIYPFFYILQTFGTFLAFGPIGVVVYLITLPYSGYYALLYFERITDCVQRIKTFFKLYFNPQLHRELKEEGDGIVADIFKLRDYLQENRKVGDDKEIYQAVL